MPDDARVQELLDPLLDTDGTPEQVCESCVELLPVVRARWRQMREARAELDVLFPPISDPGSTPPAGLSDTAPLPAVSGYEVEAVLGVGGMGVVFRARHLGLGRVVALKMALAGEYAGPRERERFRREAEAVAALRHPNVVQVYDVGEADGRPYFTMEPLDGSSLAQVLAGKPIAVRDGAATVAILAGAVEAAHRGGIVHRDLKPANILRTADGVLKVTDFGLARRLHGQVGLTRSGSALGTPSYMAPEQAGGPADAIGPTADVYALGAILYESLTGRPPFRGESAAETVHQVIHDEPVSPSRLNHRVPRDLETICLKCLHKDPVRRYQTAADLAADLSRFLGHEPIQARRTGRVERGLQWVRRRPTAAGLLAALSLLVLLGGGAAGIQYRQWAVARDRRAENEQEVRAVLDRARGQLDVAWQAQDQAGLVEALAEGSRAVDLARSGAAGTTVRDEAEAFRVEAGDHLGRMNRNRALLDAVLDVSASQETIASASYSGRPRAAAQPSADEQYANAFRRWGLDVDVTAEADLVARLRAEPDAVVRELVAALDDWMVERRRRNRPEAEWGRLLRVTEQLDGGERNRRLRALSVGMSPPRAAAVAGLVGAGVSWPGLWDVARGDAWRQLRDLRAGIDPRTDPVLTVVLLAQALAGVGDVAGAEQVLRVATTTRPDQVGFLDAMGKLMEPQGSAGRAKAIECYRAARARRPGLGVALSGALIRAGRAEEAEDLVRDLLRQGLENPILYNHLGGSLHDQKKLGPAAEAYRRAIELAPGFAHPYYNLGVCLSDQREHAAAEAACRKGLALRPQDADAHYYLGYVLEGQKRHVAAEATFRKAIDLQPDRAEAHFNLGNSLMGQSKSGLAEAAYRKAIDLRPDFAAAHSNLGMALNTQRRYGEAEAAFRRAIDLKPNDPRAHNNLGMTLSQQRRYGEAEMAYRKAIALDPKFATAHMNLGNVILEQARFDEALDVVRKGNDLLSAGDPVRRAAGDLLEWCRLYLAMDTRLPAILRGTENPADAGEQIVLAQLCRIKGLYAAAARYYGDAFTADPGVAPGRRAAAAACAARAARGDGDGSLSLGVERAAVRAKALAWLRAELTAYRKQAPPVAAAALDDWLRDPDLAGVRPGWMRMGMPARERAEWDMLWADVQAALAEARKRPSAAGSPLKGID